MRHLNNRPMLFATTIFSLSLLIPNLAIAKPKNYEQRMQALLDAHAKKQAEMVVAGEASEAQQAELIRLHTELVKAVNDAKEGGVTPEEWRAIKAQNKGVAAEQKKVVQSPEVFAAKIAARQKKVEEAKAAGTITAEQAAAKEKKLAAIKASLEKNPNAKNLKKLRASLANLDGAPNAGIFRGGAANQKRTVNTAWGIAQPVVGAANRHVDADGKPRALKRQNLMKKFGTCLGSGNFSKEETDFLRKLIAGVDKKETEFSSDGKVTAEEAGELNMIIAKAEGDTDIRCKDKNTVAAQASSGGQAAAAGNNPNVSNAASGRLRAPTQAPGALTAQ